MLDQLGKGVTSMSSLPGSPTLTSHSRCGRHREISRRHDTHRLWKLFPPLLGLLALVWFLLRVVPRPSRAMYPCQQAAMPLAAGFICWLASLGGSALALHSSRHRWRRAQRLGALTCVLLGILLGAVALVTQPERLVRANTHLPNAPIGVAQGVHPGRVVWVFAPEATNWDGPGHGHWWEAEHTLQDVVDQMMSRALQNLSGVNSDAGAWSALFTHFNLVHGRGEVGYQPGEKIVIKTNFVGCHYLWGGVDPVTYDLTSALDYMNTSPQVILALLRQLVYVAGVDPADISVGDPNGLFPNQYHDICHAEFPEVHYLDHDGGNTANPRAQVQFSTIPFFWSCQPSGVSQDYVPVSFAEATYQINLANFKSHAGAGVTLCAKNHYGSLIRWPAQSGYYDMHPSLAVNEPVEGSYRALVDLMGHAHTGDKTVLYLIDGLYSGVHPYDSAPRRWDAAPFHGDWTSSLFASQDAVAIESVCFDLMQIEGDPRQFPQLAGADDHLHEAALADNPPSGTFYDPDGGGTGQGLSSLGVHEHWNDPVSMQYSRNLGIGDGIELVISHQPTGLNGSPPQAALRLQAFPNPFNPRTTLNFDIVRAGWARLDIYSARGRRITTLLDQHLAVGRYTAIWRGRDDSERTVPAGTYFARLEADDEIASRKLVLVK